MSQRQTIQSLQPNEEVRGVFLLAQASLQQSRNGPYWRLELRDAGGSLEAKIWSPLSASFTSFAPGSFLLLSGRSSLYKDQLQLSLDACRVLEPEEEAELDLAEFMPAGPRDGEDMLAEIDSLCERELTHKPWRKFARAVLADAAIRSRLLHAPAAKAVHHAYAGGLLEHSLSVATLCLRLADHYPELDRQTLLCAALFHDIGKLEEMSGGPLNDYTDAGKMLGHIVQGLILLEPFVRKSGLEATLALHLRHLIASHHGQMEYGSPSLPATAEAFALHYADNMDAKTAQLRGQFPAPPQDYADADAGADRHAPPDSPPGVSPGASPDEPIVWSPWVSLLNRRLARAPRTPAPAVKSGADAHCGKKQAERPGGEERQCSLL